MKTNDKCKAIDDVADYFRNSAENMSPEQDNETIDHLDKSCIYPIKLVTLNAFTDMAGE